MEHAGAIGHHLVGYLLKHVNYSGESDRFGQENGGGVEGEQD